MAATTNRDSHTARDRRRWSRYDLAGAVPAVLVTETGRIACHIENVSLSGAKLRLAAASGPPGELHLDYGGNTTTSGRCAWASADSLGLDFGFSDGALALTMACLRGEISGKRAANRAG